jgi:hypothetical protein
VKIAFEFLGRPEATQRCTSQSQEQQQRFACLSQAQATGIWPEARPSGEMEGAAHFADILAGHGLAHPDQQSAVVAGGDSKYPPASISCLKSLSNFHPDFESEPTCL